MLRDKTLARLGIDGGSKGYGIFCTFITAFFPVFLVLISEFNQLQNAGTLFGFFFSNIGVFLFDILIIGLLYAAVLFPVRRSWIAALSVGFFIFSLSCIEFFKFDVSKSHFLPQDLALASDLEEISGMARLRFTPALAVSALLLALYILLLAFSGARVKARPSLRVLGGVLPLLAFGAVVLTPLSGAVYAALGIDVRETVNVFVSKSKFKNNNMIAFLSSELSNLIAAIPSKPDGYSQNAVSELISSSPAPGETKLRANVIVVFNESYGDFRRICGVDSSLYVNFDFAVENGFGGTAVMPTFGGYTCRSEFEFLSGVPLAAFSNPVLPQKLFKTRGIEGMPELFKALGYETTYIHPCDGDFYDRREIYPSYGFDRLLFEEDYDTENNLFRKYTDDGLLFSSAIDIIKGQSDPVFVFIMTMQNHQPYYYGADSGVNELAYYLEGIGHTDERIGELISAVDNADEPTLLLFIGDHLPFFGLDGNIYESIGFDESNSDVLFEQSYFMYSNYGADFSAVPAEKLSLFYLPYYALYLSNPASYPVVAQTFMDISQRLPVYASAYDTVNGFSHDAALDMLAYDRILGKGYSSGLGNLSTGYQHK